MRNFRDSWFGVYCRQNIGTRALWIFIYYALARNLPNSPLLFSGIALKFRNFLVRKIFKHVGRDVTVHAEVSFGSGINVKIGDFSSLNTRCNIANDTVIGNEVMFGPEVLILSGSHNFESIEIPMRRQGAPLRRPVIIEDDVWIGARSIILPGVHICSHSIIGAGSVVTKDVPEWAVVAGNPARIVKTRLGTSHGVVK